MKSWPALNVCQLLLPGSRTVSAPLTTVMTSFCEVEKVYSPGAITPTVAGRVAVLKPMDFTLPSKYSFTFSMVMLRKKGARVYHGIALSLGRGMCGWIGFDGAGQTAIVLQLSNYCSSH